MPLRVAYESTVETPAACATLRGAPGRGTVDTTNDAANDATTARVTRRARTHDSDGTKVL